MFSEKKGKHYKDTEVYRETQGQECSQLRKDLESIQDSICSFFSLRVCINLLCTIFFLYNSHKAFYFTCYSCKQIIENFFSVPILNSKEREWLTQHGSSIYTWFSQLWPVGWSHISKHGCYVPNKLSNFISFHFFYISMF